MDDRVLVYRGADQPDKSVINPESDVWQHIKVCLESRPLLMSQIPDAYISTNWPIRYASISSDGKLIAVAGRRGLTHYSASSGRWKLFADERQERMFVVRGGLLWFHHVLIAAVDVEKTYQVTFRCPKSYLLTRQSCAYTLETSIWTMSTFFTRRLCRLQSPSCPCWIIRCWSTRQITRCIIS